MGISSAYPQPSVGHPAMMILPGDDDAHQLICVGDTIRRKRTRLADTSSPRPLKRPSWHVSHAQHVWDCIMSHADLALVASCSWICDRELCRSCAQLECARFRSIRPPSRQ